MSLLLRIVGGGWAVLGVITCYQASSVGVDSSETTATVVIINMLLFILPGLAVYGIGARMAQKP